MKKIINEQNSDIEKLTKDNDALKGKISFWLTSPTRILNSVIKLLVSLPC